MSFTMSDLLLLELLRDMQTERYEKPDISSAKRTVLFRLQHHTASAISFTIDRKNKEQRISSLTRFYENFAKYEISPFYNRLIQG